MTRNRLILIFCALGALFSVSCTKDDSKKSPEPDRYVIRMALDGLSPAGGYDYSRSALVSVCCDGARFLPARIETDAEGHALLPAAVEKGTKQIRAYLGTADGKVSVPATVSKKSVSYDKAFEGMAAVSELATTKENEAAVRIIPLTAALRIGVMDSKWYARGEAIRSVTFRSADKKDVCGTLSLDFASGETSVEGGADKVTVNWEGDEAVRVGGECVYFGCTVLPGTFSGIFTVTTERYTYVFTGRTVKLDAGGITTVTLDLSAPNTQPTRKVGILGDSISTFDGAICNDDYSPFYPANDPNNKDGGDKSKAVDGPEKTYWYKLIYTQMKHGTLDVNSSWSGTRVIHETKTGRRTGKSYAAGFIDRCHDFVDPDIIVIHGGTNDKNQSTAQGEYGFDLPFSELNPLFYRSAYVAMLKKIWQKYPWVKVVIIVGDMLTKNYEESTVAVAEHFGLPYVNFVGDSIEKCTGSHPTAPAFTQMAEKIHRQCADYLP